MSASAVALIVVLIVLMLLGLPITWALGGSMYLCHIFRPGIILCHDHTKDFYGV